MKLTCCVNSSCHAVSSWHAVTIIRLTCCVRGIIKLTCCVCVQYHQVEMLWHAVCAVSSSWQLSSSWHAVCVCAVSSNGHAVTCCVCGINKSTCCVCGIIKWTCCMCVRNHRVDDYHQVAVCAVSSSWRLSSRWHAMCAVKLRQLRSRKVSRLTTLGNPNQIDLISQKVFIKSFFKSQFPHKSVNLFFILVTMKDKLTDLTFAKRLYKHFLWDKTSSAAPSSSEEGSYLRLIDLCVTQL